MTITCSIDIPLTELEFDYKNETREFAMKDMSNVRSKTNI
jgi:hypothetical protein